jgi:eukaryotic-like serine/threonine-protein kinase
MEQVSSGKIGRYEILRVLGRGGMGEVLLAQDENLGRRVAIKRPFKSALAEGLARFQVEAKAATLRHPNIPAVYEMGVHDELPFIAMEYVEGESLEKVIESKRDLDLITKLRIIEQVCSALGYAHDNGIIHRDIKPANIIVQPDGVAKIIDFGIAKFQDEEASSGLTKASQLIGSLHYIAPERFWGGTVDGRADLFSAGVTLFKLLTGTEPFVGGEATASFKIMNEAHAPLSAYVHDYPPALDEIVTKSLAKNPEDRFQTGEDFADSLHEVIEELKRSRVTVLFNDAERLTTERRYVPALELLDEAIKLDPSNTQARKLRKLVREHQDRIRRAERLRECLMRSDEALLSGNFDEALTQLKDAQNLDPTSADIKTRIAGVEEKKRRHDRSVKALMEAEITKSRGDVNGAMRILAKALEEDPENKKLIAASTVLTRQLEAEAQRSKLLELLDAAGKALGVKDLDGADKLLAQAEEIDAANAEVDKLRREVAKARELDQRRAALEEIEARVHEFIRTDGYEQASDLLNRALEKLPNETTLHRLKAGVDAEWRRFEARRLVDVAITRARELFPESPLEALNVLQKALDEMPGEERLVAYERVLRQELESRRSEQLRDNTVLKARELMGAQKFDQAIDILETYQMEFGQQADIDGLLAFARGELAARQQAEAVSRCSAEARTMIREGRLEEAIRTLESGLQQTSDNGLSVLLEEVRQQQAAQVRRLDALQKRVAALRGRGELDEAIRLLQEQLAATPGDRELKRLVGELEAEHKRQELTRQAIQTARDSVERNDFAAALEVVEAVSHAYGESPELTRAVQEIEQKRSAHAREMVAKSIESARAALLKKDPQGALESLKSSTALLEYADEQKQADWQRLGQAVKKALQESGSTGSHSAFDQQLAEIAQARPRRFPVWILVGAAAIVVAAVSIVLVLQLRKPVVQTVVKTQIQFQKVPAGAQVAIDGAVQTVLPNGSVIAVVKPGHHEVNITKSGFEPFIDGVDVAQGQSFLVGFQLTVLPPAGVPTGTFAVFPQSDLPNVRVFVNGESKGEKHAGQKIMLPVGTYRVKYAWPGYQDSKEHLIQIANAADIQDRIVLEKAPQSQPVQQSQKPTSAPQTAAQNPAPPVAAPAAATGKLEISSNSVERGGSVTLSWHVENASSVQITDLGAVAPTGTRPVSPTKSTVYQLIVNGSPLAEQSVEVHDAPKPQQAAVTPSVSQPAAAPSGPDKATLEHALAASYGAVFSRASGKSGKDCKAAFLNVYGGKLKDFTTWCDLAKSYTPDEQCTQLGGSPDAPTLTCTEQVVVRTKDGGTQPFPRQQKTFRFTNKDGNWQISGW